MCRVSGSWGGNNDQTEAKCPDGWTVFQDWSRTQNVYGSCYEYTCSTGMHDWGNIPREQCNPGGCCGQCAWAKIVEVGCVRGKGKDPYPLQKWEHTAFNLLYSVKPRYLQCRNLKLFEINLHAKAKKHTIG